MFGKPAYEGCRVCDVDPPDLLRRPAITGSTLRRSLAVCGEACRRGNRRSPEVSGKLSAKVSKATEIPRS